MPSATCLIRQAARGADRSAHRALGGARSRRVSRRGIQRNAGAPNRGLVGTPASLISAVTCAPATTDHRPTTARLPCAPGGGVRVHSPREPALARQGLVLSPCLARHQALPTRPPPASPALPGESVGEWAGEIAEPVFLGGSWPGDHVGQPGGDAQMGGAAVPPLRRCLALAPTRPRVRAPQNALSRRIGAPAKRVTSR